MALLLGCGGGGGPTAPASYIGDIGRNWVEKGHSEHRFNFNAAQEHVEQSSFTGFETITQSNGSEISHQLSGSFMDREIHFTVQRSGGNVLYQGQFVDDNTMSFSSASGSLILVRQIS